MLHRNPKDYISLKEINDDRHGIADTDAQDISPLTANHKTRSDRWRSIRQLVQGTYFYATGASIFIGIIAGLSLSLSKQVPYPNDKLLDVPKAKKLPSVISLHGVNITDNYTWLKNIKTDPDVKAYIEHENEYTDAYFKIDRVKRAKESVMKEIIQFESSWVSHTPGGCPLSQISSPDFWIEDDYLYWTTSLNGSYSSYFRRRVAPDSSTTGCQCLGLSQDVVTGTEELLLDLDKWVNQSTNYLQIGFFEVAPVPFSHLVAFSMDSDGSERYILRVVDTRSQKQIMTPVPNVADSAKWIVSSDKSEIWLLFNTVDDTYGVALSVYRIGPFAQNGSNVNVPQIVYTEKDPALVVSVGQSSDRQLTFIKAAGQITSESFIITNVFQKEVNLLSLRPRQVGVQYDVHKSGSQLYIRSNFEASDFAIYCASLNNATTWSPFLPPEKGKFYESIQMFQDFIVVWYWDQGLRTFKISDLNGTRWHNYPIPRSKDKRCFSIFPATLSDMEEPLRYSFSSRCLMFTNRSFVHPRKTYTIPMSSSLVPETAIILFEERFANHEPTHYGEEQVWASIQSQQLPISLFYSKKYFNDFPRPLVVIAYGAYGGYQEPSFIPEYFSLVNRGFVVAILHPRGDADLGAQWYLDGKFEKKKNTFSDVCESIQSLVSMGYAQKDHIALKGRSAGGLVAGNAILWPSDSCLDIKLKTVIALVPFIDPIGDLLDPLVPWTIYEWYEWGNPANKTIFDSQIAYSPYYSLSKYPAPSIYVSSGLKDSRVPFWEPVKYVAKIRSLQQSLLIENRKIETSVHLRVLNSGHFASNEGMDQIAEIAEWVSFIVINTIE